MLPMAIVVRLNEDDKTHSKAAAAAPAATAAPTGFFENMIACFTPIFGGHQPLMDKTNTLNSTLSIAERLEQVADVDSTKEMVTSILHQSGQAEPAAANGIKAVPTAVIEANKTEARSRAGVSGLCHSSSSTSPTSRSTGTAPLRCSTTYARRCRDFKRRTRPSLGH